MLIWPVAFLTISIFEFAATGLMLQAILAGNPEGDEHARAAMKASGEGVEE